MQELCLPLLYEHVGLSCSLDGFNYEIAEMATARLAAWCRAVDNRVGLADLVKTAWVYEPGSFSRRVRSFRNLQHLTTSTRDLFSSPVNVQSPRPRLLTLECFDDLDGSEGWPVDLPSKSFDLSGLRSLAMETVNAAPWQWLRSLSPGLESLKLEMWGLQPEPELAAFIERQGPSLRYLRLVLDIAEATGLDVLPSLAVSCPNLLSVGMIIPINYEHEVHEGLIINSRGRLGQFFSKLLRDGHPTMNALELGSGGLDWDRSTTPHKASVSEPMSHALQIVASLAAKDDVAPPKFLQLRRLVLPYISLEKHAGADNEIETLIGLGLEVIDKGGSAAKGLAARREKDVRLAA